MRRAPMGREVTGSDAMGIVVFKNAIVTNSGTLLG